MEHEKKLTELQRALRAQKEVVSFSAHDHPSHTLRKRTARGIDISSLRNILEITDTWAVVEPRVTFRQLCRATLRRGLVPPVVPEFPNITIGGAVMGAALESSSHRFGQVSDTCLEYELLLGNGERLVVSPDQHPDLFYGLSGSYGSLALLTKIKIQLIPAQPYVHLVYKEMALPALIDFLNQPHKEDFVEGVALTPTSGIATTGTMTAERGTPYFSQRAPWSRWYIQRLLENPPQEAWMRLEEYLFRFDLGAFWMGQYARWGPILSHLFFHTPISRLRSELHPSFLFRLLFGWTVRSGRLYRIRHRAAPRVSARLFFVHDFYAPAPVAQQVADHFIQKSGILPVWLCPLKGTDTPQFLSPHYGKPRFVNIGLYGQPTSTLSLRALSAECENDIVSYGGRKMLYSYTYYPWDRFTAIYDNERYMHLRKTYHAEPHFPHLYHKIVS